MPIKFAAIDEYLDTEGISLPINGKDYVIPVPDGLTGLEVTRLMAAVAPGESITPEQMQELIDLDTLAGGDLERRVLGTAFDEMVADGVKWPAMKLAFQTAMVWIAKDAEQAAMLWLFGGGALGKAPKVPQDRKARTRKGRPASTASKTPSR